MRFYPLRKFHIFAKHDDRKGHHYYTRITGRRRSIVVMTLAVIMLTILRTLLANKLSQPSSVRYNFFNVS